MMKAVSRARARGIFLCRIHMIFTRLRRTNARDDVEGLFAVSVDACKWTTEARDVGLVFVEQLETFLRVVENGFELLLDLVDTGGSRFSLTRGIRRLR